MVSRSPSTRTSRTRGSICSGIPSPTRSTSFHLAKSGCAGGCADGTLGGAGVSGAGARRLGYEHLERARLGVDDNLLVLRPRHRLVVGVDPEQDVDVALFGLEDDSPVLLIDPDRAHVRVTERLNLLVVDRRACRVGPELPHELAHLLLLRAGQSSEGIEELVVDGDAEFLRECAHVRAPWAAPRRALISGVMSATH